MIVRNSIRSAIRRPAAETRRLAREEGGVALMLTLAVFLLLYVLCCGVYATGEIVRQRIQVQNACDAAAYSAAVVQADALSRMAVVNRAMAWTYIQLCREQMDYIVFSWLKLTCDRFVWDRYNKADDGDINAGMHYYFKNIGGTIGIVSWGLYDYFHRHDDAYYTGVGDTLAERKQEHVSLNGRNDFKDSVAVKDIKSVLEDIGGDSWKRGMEESMGYLKEAIFGLNGTLGMINMAMTKSIPATAKYVLFQNLPKGEQGKVETSTAKDFYWTVVGGVGGIPLAYTGEVGGADPMGSYFEGLFNTEEDEIQFLQMADGLPGQKAGAPGWMKNGSRYVVLSDYFGTPGHPEQTGMGKTRFVAGGLDQWYVRGPSNEVMDVRKEVPKQFLQDPPGGIQRVYKHTNRDEGKTLWKYHRPNHIFQGGLDVVMGTGDFEKFRNPGKMIQDLFKNAGGEIGGDIGEKLGGRAGRRIGRWYGRRIGNIPGGIAGTIGDLGGVAGDALGNLAGGNLGDLLKAIQEGDIPPSDEHSLARYPDQCRNVSESTGLVSQYEWASAYWLDPWVRTPWGLYQLGHWRLPVSALRGCEEHGYASWLATQIKVLFKDFGATRRDYKSCFINFDSTRSQDENTILRGHARIYGDDAEIFNEVGYVGQVARPWILGKSFFSGDGTILVGLARRQKNPFMRMMSWATERDGGKPSLYEPFSPQPGRDRFLVGLSAARAAWAPRPDRPVTGMESMNAVEGQRAPGNYEPRWDAVTDHKFEIEGGGIGGTRFGCVCGKRTTHERLKRMWNLSQTDWDATLLPLRHAYDDHSEYDSYKDLKDGSFWEYTDVKTNAVAKMVGILQGPDVTWKNGAVLLAEQVPGQSGGMGSIPPALSTSDIMAFPDATGVPIGEPGSLYLMFLFRRLL